MATLKAKEDNPGLAIRNKFGRIGILMGGASTEREISLKSGTAVYEVLTRLGLDAVAIDIKTDKLRENIDSLKSQHLDCVFIALHGRFGEDGQIQEILEGLNIPYSGSGVLASRLAMDKVASRSIFQKHNLAVPPYEVVDKASYARGWNFSGRLSLPLVVKPVAQGSSIGLSMIDKIGELGQAIETALAFDERVLIEQYIKGRELTVGVLEEKALPIVEIIPKHRFFDYDAKYHAGVTDYIVPAKLKPEITQKVQQTGLAAHKLLGCFGCSRVDIILNNDSIPFILEVNTIPGLTSTSLLPKAARFIGIEFSELCIRLLESAYEKARI